MSSHGLWRIGIVGTVAVAVAAIVAGIWLSSPTDKPVLVPGWTPAVGVVGSSGGLADPFGVAIDVAGTIYVADGAGGNSIRTISPAGVVSTLAGGQPGFVDGVGASARFRTPSSLVIDAAGAIYVTDTGNNAVRRITPGGIVTTVTQNLNAPIGIAMDMGGRILVSDTYNDRVVALDRGGAITELPLGIALDTPTGLAIAQDGTLYIADTGNNVVHAVSPSGVVSTFDAMSVGGMQRPIGLAVDHAGALYVSDEASRIFEITSIAGSPVTRILAGGLPGYRNGLGQDAQFRQPAGLAAVAPGRLVVADAGNRLVRSVTATSLATAGPPPSPWIAPGFDVTAFAHTPLLWPLDPLGGPFEIAGTIGEARGEDAARFHAGIDIRAENGAPVLAVREATVSSPLASGDFGSLNEWLRLGDVAYVHLRVGRTLDGEPTDDTRFAATRDERGRIMRIRVKRGARFQAGDAIGSVNAFNHVHLNVGGSGEEYNPLLFRLVQFEDTIPPTIARGGIRLFDPQGVPITTRVKGRLQVAGHVQIVVDAWDRANGNSANRRLGVYALGYQVLSAAGAPAPGFEQPLETIRFDRLIDHPDATRLVYAPGSGIPFYGQRRTRFLYVVTNTFRNGVAAPGIWDTGVLPPGDYVLRVRVADIRGNEARQNRDLPLTITGRGETAGG